MFFERVTITHTYLEPCWYGRKFVQVLFRDQNQECSIRTSASTSWSSPGGCVGSPLPRCSDIPARDQTRTCAGAPNRPAPQHPMSVTSFELLSVFLRDPSLPETYCCHACKLARGLNSVTAVELKGSPIERLAEDAIAVEQREFRRTQGDLGTAPIFQLQIKLIH